MITTSPLILLPGCTRKFAALLCLAGLVHSTPTAAAAPQPTIAELMELGVYSEETKGDIDAAMKVYQQILDDAKTGQSIAAQALFRLAICHDKKGDIATAAATFERLIKEYPAEKELVGAASDYLADGAALLPAPWQDGETLTLDLKLPSGVKIGAASYSVRAAERDGRATWQFTSLLFANFISISTTETEAGSMKPLHAEAIIRSIAQTETTYTGGRAELKAKGLEPRTIELGGVVYDNEEALQLIRRLPLAPGFKRTFKALVAPQGGVVVPVQLEVTGTETVQCAAGSFVCHKILLSAGGPSQTLWYTTDASHTLVKFEAIGVVAELSAIKRSGPDQPTPVHEPTLGYEFSAPAGWLVRPGNIPAGSKYPTYNLVDEAGTAIITFSVTPQKDFAPAQVASVRAYADHQVAMGKQFTPVFEVHPDSWKETSVGGQPALTCVADHARPPLKNLAVNTFALVEGNAICITAYVDPENLDALWPKYEALIASYHGK
ncbi:MAG TPA: tetratricopeptide repeat protein [Opitutaceae bacterium]|nr:tetratricopeptide repeat protein [Opitutaceae bacterium]